jgi:hypothetical protein
MVKPCLRKKREVAEGRKEVLGACRGNQPPGPALNSLFLWKGKVQWNSKTCQQGVPRGLSGKMQSLN